jgi:uncharacterized protein DUF481
MPAIKEVRMRFSIVVAALVLVAVEARADEVVMKNGDKITGKVVDLAGGKLKVETAHSGVVVLEWSQVATIKTDAPVKVKLASGETVEGKIGAGQDGKILIESAGAGPLQLAPDGIKSFNEPPVAWHGAVDLAARTSDGNTHSSSMLLAFEASRATEVDKLLFKAVFRYGETRNVITERNGYGQVKYDYLFSERAPVRQVQGPPAALGHRGGRGLHLPQEPGDGLLGRRGIRVRRQRPAGRGG